MQPALLPTIHYTVSQVTLRIRKALEENPDFRDIWVDGEISNLSRPASGHVYFTLKDRNASLRCVIWKADAARLRAALQEGLAVEAYGRIAVYEPQGQYQLIVRIVQPRGEGDLYQEFLRLKSRLEAEGLFDEERKRPLPQLPARIGIVTSPSGAALRDMLDTLARRLPLAEVLLSPSPVQGEEAPPALVQALRVLNGRKPDVILLARGGGSIEDLWAFNDERVVRAVAASEAPLVCGVGHETDFTLCDFAADLRAPTPTAAAELATPLTSVDLLAGLRQARGSLAEAIQRRLTNEDARVAALAARMRYLSPRSGIQTGIQRVDDLARRAFQAVQHALQIRAAGLDGGTKRLLALNPLGVLARGYAIITRQDDGTVVSRVSQAGGEMRVRVSDGTFEVRKS